MIFLYLTLLAPIFGIILMTIIGHLRIAGIINVAILAVSFIASIFLAFNFLAQNSVPILAYHQQFYIDAFSLLSIILTTFITTTTAIFSKNYIWHNVTSAKITKQQVRLYHIMYQAFALTMLLTLSTNNIGIIWVAMEGATLATVLLVSLYRTPKAVEAAWKYFILCIVGIALALFGTVLVYSSASSSASQLFADANSHAAILFSNLYQHASTLDMPTMKIAFVFLLVGYGTKIGLVPLHNWLPDAHSESPAPMSALLSGLLLNAALYALVRFKILTDLTLHNHLAGNLMIGFGLLSFLVAAVLLHRQRNIKRMFSYSSIENMGLMTFAFGIGGHLATFGAIFYMLMHSLTKSAIFVTVGNVIQLTGTQSMEKIRGLIQHQPILGWGLLIATLAICGFPPCGIFISKLLLIIATINYSPWLTALIIIGIIIALAGLLKNIQPIVYGECSIQEQEKIKMKITMFPAILHLALVFILGIYIPPALATLLQQATTIISGGT